MHTNPIYHLCNALIHNFLTPPPEVGPRIPDRATFTDGSQGCLTRGGLGMAS